MEVRKLFNEHKYNLCKRTDRVFALLMAFQLLLVSVLPLTTDFAMATACLIGILPIYFALFKPGTSLSRYINTLAQMCFASLFIHLMGGKPEAHFIVFGSLAFLAMYRDWKILVLASALALLDQFIRGVYFPFSFYGANNGIDGRWLEYAAWILFENVFLIYICLQSANEMKLIAAAKLELMQTRAEVENIHVRRTQFFSLISHEIRTPLNGIINFTDFLKEPATPETHREYVGIIKQCSDSLLRLVNDLLDFSKIDSGRLEIDPHPFKINDIQEYLQNIFLFECQKKKLNFFVEVGEDVPNELVGDAHRIRQVLVNIVSNAIKFTEFGSIRVRFSRVAEEEDVYRWDVEDTGIGIKKDSLNKLFSPYTQEFSSTARKYGGSGLGLAISRKLVELMGGKLDVESTLGKGSLFFFTLPLK